jgi:ribosomal protein S18 acetylase RimI-like enzyme
MTVVRKLRQGDTSAVVDRIARQLSNDASRHTLVNPDLDLTVLHDTIVHATSATWVALDGDDIVGHLFAAVLRDHERRAAWTGPDGVSFDDPSILESLLRPAIRAWRSQGAIEHLVWALDDDDRLDPWRQLGYHAISVRGVMDLEYVGDAALDTSLRLRLATSQDIDAILHLDHIIDVAQGDESSLSRKIRRHNRREIRHLLDDPDVEHYVLERVDRIVAQAVTYPSPARRGSFEHTLHLSGVAVDSQLQGRGIASAMLNEILRRARARGVSHVEAQWRVDNVQASSFWPAYGLEPTYVRLARRLAE